MSGTDTLLSTFDVDEMATEALLFQTGYLTIAGEPAFPTSGTRRTTSPATRGTTRACSTGLDVRVEGAGGGGAGRERQPQAAG